MQRTTYIPKELYRRLEKYREPNRRVITAIEKLLDIAERRETLVVAVRSGKIHCNKMKEIRQPNRVYCKMLETIVSKDYCMTKCIVAPIIEELLEEAEPSKRGNEKTATLASFLETPKLEHLRYPPRIEKDRCGSCWIFSGFLTSLNVVQKRWVVRLPISSI